MSPDSETPERSERTSETLSIECSNGRCRSCDRTLSSGEPCGCSCHRKIEPALTREEWAAKKHTVIRNYQGDLALGLRASIEARRELLVANLEIESESYHDKPESLWAIIALANDCLPDSDPRKITRKMIATLKGEDGGWVSVEYTRKIAAALESYLPPEEPS